MSNTVQDLLIDIKDDLIEYAINGSGAFDKHHALALVARLNEAIYRVFAVAPFMHIENAKTVAPLFLRRDIDGHKVVICETEEGFVLYAGLDMPTFPNTVARYPQ